MSPAHTPPHSRSSIQRRKRSLPMHAVSSPSTTRQSPLASQLSSKQDTSLPHPHPQPRPPLSQQRVTYRRCSCHCTSPSSSQSSTRTIPPHTDRCTMHSATRLTRRTVRQDTPHTSPCHCHCSFRCRTALVSMTPSPLDTHSPHDTFHCTTLSSTRSTHRTRHRHTDCTLQHPWH